ncbi:Esterase OS=Lysinibacillus sphaericus OX=1421 GN=LS41612_11205 PE=4 SV=1 [Lysinibacillus sphaericus]
MTRLTKEAIRYIQETARIPHYYEMTPQEARNSRTVPPWQSSHSPQLASIENKKISVRDGQEINIRIYIPEQAEKLPVIIYYHGGGWGRAGNHDYWR